VGLLTGNVTHGQRAKNISAAIPRKLPSATHAHRIDRRRDAGVRTARSSVPRRPSRELHMGLREQSKDTGTETVAGILSKTWDWLASLACGGSRLGGCCSLSTGTSQIESGLKRWEREDLRSGSRSARERRANLPNRSWFPSIVSRTFKNALPTGKSISAGESERARFLRRISWARTRDHGGMGLSTWFDFSEMCVLVFFLSRKYFTTKWKLEILSAVGCTKISAGEQSFGVWNHDVVTTSE
jgi:hypothetical protein